MAMHRTFSRSVRAIVASNSGRHSTLLLGATFSAAWMAWLLMARVPVTIVADDARIEVRAASYPVAARVAGVVRQVHVELGDTVAKGQLLVSLDASSHELRLTELARSNISLGQRRDSVERAIEALRDALTAHVSAGVSALRESDARRAGANEEARFSVLQADRAAALHAEGIESTSEFERTRAGAETRRADADALSHHARGLVAQRSQEQADRRAEIERLVGELADLEGRVAMQPVEIERLQKLIANHHIRAPLGGTVGDIAAMIEGTVVELGHKLASVVPPGTLRVVGHFEPGAAAGRLRPGHRALLKLDAYPWIQYGGLHVEVMKVAGEVRDGLLRVELAFRQPVPDVIPLRHGLPGVLEATVEEASPAVLLLRSLGKRIETAGRGSAFASAKSGRRRHGAHAAAPAPTGEE